MTTPIRVVIVDDQQLVRVGFQRILETEPGIEVVGEAEDGAGPSKSCAGDDRTSC
jgi:DNA-binding NarL/FixJ family response regulator